MREVAVVPVKSLTEAKKRLAGALSSEDRQSIVIAMLNDVLHSLNRANLFGRVEPAVPLSSVGKIFSAIEPTKFCCVP